MLKRLHEGRCGGPVVSVLAFYSNGPSSNLTEAYNLFCCKMLFEKNENEKKSFLHIPRTFLD